MPEPAEHTHAGPSGCQQKDPGHDRSSPSRRHTPHPDRARQLDRHAAAVGRLNTEAESRKKIRQGIPVWMRERQYIEHVLLGGSRFYSDGALMAYVRRRRRAAELMAHEKAECAKAAKGKAKKLPPKARPKPPRSSLPAPMMARRRRREAPLAAAE